MANNYYNGRGRNKIRIWMIIIEWVWNAAKELPVWLHFLRSNAEHYSFVHPSISDIITHSLHLLRPNTPFPFPPTSLPFPTLIKNAIRPRFNYYNSNGFVGSARGQARRPEGQSEGGDPSAAIHRKGEELNGLYRFPIGCGNGHRRRSQL